MIKLKLREFKRTSRFLKRLPRFLAEKSFLTFLSLFFIVLFLGLAIFYSSYFLLAETFDRIVKEKELLKIDAKSQQKVFEEWQKRNEKFRAADFKEYPNMFR